MKTVLVTGAGSGFGLEVAMRLAEKGFDVIAAVEIYAQVQTLKRQAATRGVSLRVEKLDVTNDGDRKKALAWNVEILVNNAGVLARVYQVSCGRSLRIAAFPYVFWMICAARVYRLTGQ